MPHSSTQADSGRSALSSKLTWVALALLGILVAAGVSVAASRLSSQRIGLASEPISAGRELAPPSTTGTANAGQRDNRRHGSQQGSNRGAAGTPAPPPAATTAPTAPSTSPPSVSGQGDDSEESHSGGGDD